VVAGLTGRAGSPTAHPNDKAEVYHQLGLRLTYDPTQKR